jgi:transposase
VTAATLVAEVFVRSFADRRALARFVGLTGTPDESGSRRRDRGLMKAGSARVRHIMIQLAWRMIYHQPNAALVQWYRDRVGQGQQRGQKNLHRGIGEQAADRFVALCADRRSS